MSHKAHLKFLVFLSVIFILLVLYSWEPKICFNPDEMFYFKSSQTLTDIRNLPAPEYYGEHRFQKPPLYYLTVFLSFKAFGINWFSARVVTVLFAILALVFTYLLGIEMFGREKAFWGSAALATSVLFFRFGRIVLPEMAIVSLMTGAFYFAYRAFRGNETRCLYLSFLMMAIASLVKGPVGFLLPGSAALAYHVMNRRDIRLRFAHWGYGLAMILCFNFFLWFIPALLMHGGDFLKHMVNIELADRFIARADSISSIDHVWFYLRKAVFYIPVALAEYLPWTALFPVAFIALRRDLERTGYGAERRFLIVWIAAGFLLFTMVQAKRAHYVLSLFPAISLYLVSFLDFGLPEVKRIFRVFLSATLAVYLVAVVFVLPLVFTDGVDRLSRVLANELDNNDANVAVSWRLDPQEVEFYLDRPVAILYEDDLSGKEGALLKIGTLISKQGDNGLLFYVIIAREEYEEHFETFMINTKEVSGGPVTAARIDEDLRWSKTIKFMDMMRDLISDPRGWKKHFDDAFKEEVFLLTVRKKQDAGSDR